jgi:hypothetical protein
MRIQTSTLESVATLRRLLTERLTKLQNSKTDEDGSATMMNLIPPFTVQCGAQAAHDVFYRDDGLLYKTVYRDVCAGIRSQTPTNGREPTAPVCETVRISTVWSIS